MVVPGHSHFIKMRRHTGRDARRSMVNDELSSAAMAISVTEAAWNFDPISLADTIPRSDCWSDMLCFIEN